MRHVSLLLGLLLCFSASKAQDLARLLDDYNNKVPQEKLYIQFDNNIYTPGQTLWYKAYLQNGNKPSALSTNLYLDWYDASGKLIAHHVAPVMNATASGSYTIPAAFTGQSLRVLAYTKWMLNFDSALLFSKTLTVVPQQVSGKNAAVVPEQSRTILGFYPEGGELVENIHSVLAFKAVNSAGEPVQVSGVIVNKEGKTVSSFAATHNGMGKLVFTPAPGETYTAQWTDPGGIRQNTPLPVARTSGIVLTVNNTAISRSITIQRSDASAQRFTKLNIVATMNQQVLFRASANLSAEQKIQANIPTERFPSGVVCLTIFDADNRQPLAERVVFVNNDEYRTDVSIAADTVNLDKKGKNVYSIQVPDSMISSLSLSITDAGEKYDASSGILSGLLLSPDIRGRIQNPAYYFSSAEDSVAAQLDLVMLTNGWRRFRWNDVIAGTTPQLRFGRDTSYLSIEGSISNISEKRITKAGVMNLMIVSKDSSKQFLFAPIQSDGSFRQDNLVLYDSSIVYFRLNNKTNIPWRSKVKIRNGFDEVKNIVGLPSIQSWMPDTAGLARVLALTEEQKRVDELRKKTTLAEVTVFAKTKTRMEQLDERHTTGAFKNAGHGYGFNILDDKNAQASPDIFSYLQGRVPGITIRISGALGTVTVVRNARKSLTGGPAVVPIYINEMLAPDNEMVKALPVSSISYIKVIPPPFVEDVGGGQGGAIAIYTLSGDDIPEMLRNTPSMQLDKAELIGYTPVKEFYSPDYATLQPNMDEKDFRRTLLWNPDILTDGTEKKVAVSFYNNDVSKSLRLVLEGMTAEGRLVHVVKEVR